MASFYNSFTVAFSDELQRVLTTNLTPHYLAKLNIMNTEILQGSGATDLKGE